MRKYPYKLDEKLVKENREATNNLLNDLRPELPKAKAERNAMFFKIFGQAVEECGAYSYVFCEPMPIIQKYLREAHGYYTWAIGFDLVLDPYEYLNYLALAVVVNDVKQAECLAAFPRSRYTHSDVEASAVIYSLAESMGHLVLKSGKLRESLKDSKKHLSSKKIIPYDKTLSEPLISMLSALAARDQAAFEEAVDFRQRNFSRLSSMPNNRYQCSAFIDMTGLAIVRLALADGLSCAQTNAHMPLELIRPHA